MEIPKIWIWTRKLIWDSCVNIVKEWLEIWYTHIDTAQIYWNEKEIWKWIKESCVNRNNFFLTTKVWIKNFWYKSTINSIERSLKDLNTDYIDLVLLHWPVDKNIHIETYNALLSLKDKWKINKIWVSNFTIEYLSDLINNFWNEIYNNQIEYHLEFVPKNIKDYCDNNNIKVSAYSPLWHWEILNNEYLKKIADEYDKTTAQIALKWLIQTQWVIIIPKTSKIENLKSNIEIFDFELSDNAIEIINDNIIKDNRIINPWFAPKWDD